MKQGKKEQFAREHEALLAWYEVCGRKHLPWRNLDPAIASYGVYVSEIMLQQTQVSSVLGYFERFMQAYPTLEALSGAKEEEVLVLWRGLGYYSRAKNLLKTARLTGGKLPDNLESLKKLAGIGDYTAGAILCFGFGKAVGFFDTNIKRFLSRFFAISAPSAKILQSLADGFLNKKDAFNHNQALLDLGALVCIAKNPRCNICPLARFCKGVENPTLYTPRKVVAYEVLEVDLGLYEEEGRIAMVRDREYNLLYGLPRLQSPADGQPSFTTEAKIPLLGSFKHSRTRYKITARVYAIPTRPKDSEMIAIKDLPTTPLSSFALKALKICGIEVEK